MYIAKQLNCDFALDIQLRSCRNGNKSVVNSIVVGDVNRGQLSGWVDGVNTRQNIFDMPVLDMKVHSVLFYLCTESQTMCAARFSRQLKLNL